MIGQCTGKKYATAIVDNAAPTDATATAARRRFMRLNSHNNRSLRPIAVTSHPVKTSKSKKRDSPGCGCVQASTLENKQPTD
jgi:hypothetical protein